MFIRSCEAIPTERASSIQNDELIERVRIHPENTTSASTNRAAAQGLAEARRRAAKLSFFEVEEVLVIGAP